MKALHVSDSTVLSINVLGKSMKPIPLLMNGFFIKRLYDSFLTQCMVEEHVECNIE